MHRKLSIKKEIFKDIIKNEILKKKKRSKRLKKKKKEEEKSHNMRYPHNPDHFR